MASPSCPHCQSRMIPKVHVTGQREGCSNGCLLIGIGLLLFLIPVIGWVIGPLCILAGLLQGGKRNRVWLCGNPACQHVMPRLIYSSGEVAAILIATGLCIAVVAALLSKPDRRRAESETDASGNVDARDDRGRVPVHLPAQLPQAQPQALPVERESPLLRLWEGMAYQDTVEAMSAEGRKRRGMKGRDGIERATYEWVMADGQILVAQFENDRLVSWEATGR